MYFGYIYLTIKFASMTCFTYEYIRDSAYWHVNKDVWVQKHGHSFCCSMCRPLAETGPSWNCNDVLVKLKSNLWSLHRAGNSLFAPCVGNGCLNSQSPAQGLVRMKEGESCKLIPVDSWLITFALAKTPRNWSEYSVTSNVLSWCIATRGEECVN